MYTEEQMRLIFARIGLSYDPSLKRDVELLARIQHAFLTTVPYENLDILAGIPLSFEPEALYDKIVTRRRGGYCFELNGFLAFVLRDLGYPLKEYMGRFLQGETSIPMRATAVDTRRPLSWRERDHPLKMPGCFRQGDDHRKDNGTPVLNASQHWAALSERQLGS